MRHTKKKIISICPKRCFSDGKKIQHILVEQIASLQYPVVIITLRNFVIKRSRNIKETRNGVKDETNK